MAPTISQALKELAKLQQLHERRPGGQRGDITDVETARAINLTLRKAALGLANPRELALARQMCFQLTGSPEIGPEWGPPVIEPYRTIDVGKPNQVAPVAPVVVSTPDPRVLYLDDKGKAPAARPYRDARHGGKEQR